MRTYDILRPYSVSCRYCCLSLVDLPAVRLNTLTLALFVRFVVLREGKHAAPSFCRHDASTVTHVGDVAYIVCHVRALFVPIRRATIAHEPELSTIPYGISSMPSCSSSFIASSAAFSTISRKSRSASAQPASIAATGSAGKESCFTI